MTFYKYIQLFVKDLNRNKSVITGVFFTIFISLFIFSSVTILKNSIENEIKNNSRILLGGDLELSTKNKALGLNILDELKEDFFLTKVVEFTTIIRTNSEKNTITRIKVVDNFYPLVGNAIIVPNNSLETLKTKPNTILIDESIQNNLNLKLGQKVKIQNTTFEVIGIIKSLPDIGGFFFGDQALINESSFKSLKINNLGSFFTFKYKLKKKYENQELPSKIKKYKNLEIKYPEDVSQNLKKLLKILFTFVYYFSIIYYYLWNWFKKFSFFISK